MGAATLIPGCSTPPSQMYPYPQGKKACLPDPSGDRSRSGYEVHHNNSLGLLSWSNRYSWAVLIVSLLYLAIPFPISWHIDTLVPPFLCPDLFPYKHPAANSSLVSVCYICTQVWCFWYHYLGNLGFIQYYWYSYAGAFCHARFCSPKGHQYSLSVTCKFGHFYVTPPKLPMKCCYLHGTDFKFCQLLILLSIMSTNFSCHVQYLLTLCSVRCTSGQGIGSTPVTCPQPQLNTSQVLTITTQTRKVFSSLFLTC